MLGKRWYIPHRDKDQYHYLSRVSVRAIRYPNWRQVFYDCDGVCVRCGSLDDLEFHETYNDKGDVDKTVLLCNGCHSEAHNGQIVNPRRYPSKLQEDVEIEIMRCGGLEKWKEKFQIKDH